MRESERLTMQGVRLLEAKGWPREAIIELMDMFVLAGVHLAQEQARAEFERNETIIQKALAN